MRTISGCILSASITALLTAAMIGTLPVGAAAQDTRSEVRVPYLQYPIGGGWEGFYVFDRFVAERHPWLRTVQQETGGYVHNKKVMHEDTRLQEGAVFGSTTGSMFLAETAYKPFFEEAIPSDNWRHLFGEYLLGQSWFATFNCDEIKGVEDLEGRSVGVGLLTQTHWGGIVTFMLEHGYGITRENTQINYLGPVKAMDALFDGAVDAALVSVNLDANQEKYMIGPTVERLAASGRDYCMLPWPREVVNRVVQETGIPLYAVTLPPDTVPNQPEPFEIFADIGIRSAHKDFPEDLAYEITKAFIEIGPEAGQLSAIGVLWTPETMISPFAFDWNQKDQIHPGAQRAYEEAGMWPPETVWEPIPIEAAAAQE